MKSQELLNDLATYCKEHPSERFWQALRNWSGHEFILALAAKDFHLNLPKHDTFYWNSKDGK